GARDGPERGGGATAPPGAPRAPRAARVDAGRGAGRAAARERL
ncbi:MAG: hypothetical protein AVDCRST_MAG79-3101, partial [uncultured Thermoleophilia bacterium]